MFTLSEEEEMDKIEKFCKENRIEAEYNINKNYDGFYMFYKDGEDIFYAPDTYKNSVILSGLKQALEKYNKNGGRK